MRADPMLRVRRNMGRASPRAARAQPTRVSRVPATLFGATHQLDARLRGVHQAAIRRQIIERHAARGESRLELFSDRSAVELREATDSGDGAGFITDDETGQA